MKTEADELPRHEAVAAIRKHMAWLVRDHVLTPHAAIELQRAFERAVAESRDDRLAVVAVVEGLVSAIVVD
ncbi:MAG TPA: hypothetical protein PLS95_17620, partial [Thermoanaerobaculales bacterium]|nr:hypothetical protein [Thermoanaerobaculales bacterium]